VSTAARFSIVICNYNQDRFVGEALRSCLAQTVPRERFEIIVVDDGSTDDSKAVLADFARDHGVHVVLQENRGQLAALVAGIRHASHELVCFLDADDTFSPTKLARVAERVDELVPLPEHFFLCHDVELIDHARGVCLERSWLEMMGTARFGPSLYLDLVDRDFPFAGPCGQVVSLATARLLAETVTAWEWRGGADMVIAHGAFLVCGVVHFLPECLAQYRIHGSNTLATVQGGRFVPKPLWIDRWPKLARYLEQLLDTLDLDTGRRASRLAHLKRLERIARFTATTHRFAEPTIGFVVQGGEPAQLEATIDACLAQGHPKVVVAVTGALAGFVDTLPERHRGKVIAVEPAASPLADLGAGYAAAGGDYVCFLESGDLPDPAFAERHLYVHRYGAVCHLTSSDFRVIDAADVMLHSNVMNNAGRFRPPLETLTPFSSTIEEWPFPPLAASVFRRSAFLDRLFADLHRSAAFARHPAWLLLQCVHNIAGSVRINECLLSLRVRDAADVTYARLLAPLDAEGHPNEPEPVEAAGALAAFFGHNEGTFGRHLAPVWWEAFADWLMHDLSDDEVLAVQAHAAKAGGARLAHLLTAEAD